MIGLTLACVLALGFGASVSDAQVANAPPAPATAVSGADDYRLGSADKVRVLVFGEDSLSGEFVVSGTGALSLPLIGNISVLGLTATEVQNAIAAALKEGYLRDPKVSVEVLNFRPFYILGEVNKPGEYPYTNGLTVFNAVARAEGFTYRADTRKVFLKHAAESAEHSMPLNTTTVVQPGDTIRIGERFF
jgi:polysaccharide export outer membrane protein